MVQVLAHVAPELTPSDIGEIAMTIIFLAALIVPLVVLGVVCWIFWKAKVREDAERKAEWPSAPSS